MAKGHRAIRYKSGQHTSTRASGFSLLSLAGMWSLRISNFLIESIVGNKFSNNSPQVFRKYLLALLLQRSNLLVEFKISLNDLALEEPPVTVCMLSLIFYN
jgi:hypothetical protein